MNVKRAKKRLTFVEVKIDGARKTKLFQVQNAAGQILGGITFKPQWRKYVLQYSPLIGTVDFDNECLREVTEFLEIRTTQWRLEHGSRQNNR